MTDAHVAGGEPPAADAPPPPIEGWVERACQFVCNVSLAAMVVVIGAEAVARLFGTALEASDEIGGYLLVSVTFLSLAVGQATRAFHRLELVQQRLRPRGRAISAVIFDVLALAFSAILLWQLARLEWLTWISDDMAPTELMTPLWIPRLSMPLGAAALCYVLLKDLISNSRRLAAIANAHTETR